MVTVRSLVINYCKDKSLPDPSNNDLRELGFTINHEFRHKWALVNHAGEGPIPDAGFVIQEEPGRLVTVIAYPGAFMEIMLECIHTFYKNKKSSPEPKQKPPAPIKQRTEFRQRKRFIPNNPYQGKSNRKNS